MAEQSREQIAQQIAERSLSDPAFRQSLKESPHRVLREEFGLPIPLGFTIRVVEETPNTYYLVLPPADAAVAQELSLDDLAGVTAGYYAGGDSSCKNLTIQY